jgi:hypothetical protein
MQRRFRGRAGYSDGSIGDDEKGRERDPKRAVQSSNTILASSSRIDLQLDVGAIDDKVESKLAPFAVLSVCREGRWTRVDC